MNNFTGEINNKTSDTVYFRNNAMLKNHGVSFHWWSSDTTSLHSHDFCEIFIITDGEAIHELNGEYFRLGKGTVHFIKPTDLHIIKASKEKGCVHMNLCIRSDRFKKVLEALSIDEVEFFSDKPIRATVPADELELFTKKAGKINLMKFDDEPGSTVAICDLIVQAVIVLYNSSKSSFSDYPEWFAAILEKIHSPDFLGCTANDIYSLGNFSAPAMIEYFKKYTGKTVLQYLKSVKIKNAKSLLKNTDLSIVEISNKLGYASLSHFNKMFKEYTGITPSAYRKSRNALML